MQVKWNAKKIWFQIHCTSQTAKLATKQRLEKYSIWCNQNNTSIRQAESAKDISWFIFHSSQKRGDLISYDGFKKISGTKIHVAVNQNSLPISVVICPANQHDSTRFVDVMKNLHEHLDDDTIRQIKSIYADKGYDSTTIREYLRNTNIRDCIPRRNYKINGNYTSDKINYNKTRYVVERFFAWLKCGFRRLVIRYERIAENYLAFVNIASFLMYWRVLGWVVYLILTSLLT